MLRFRISIFGVTKIAYSLSSIALGREAVVPFAIESLTRACFKGYALVIVKLGARTTGTFLDRGHYPFFYKIEEVLRSKTAL